MVHENSQNLQLDILMKQPVFYGTNEVLLALTSSVVWRLEVSKPTLAPRALRRLCLSSPKHLVD